MFHIALRLIITATAYFLMKSAFLFFLVLTISVNYKSLNTRRNHTEVGSNGVIDTLECVSCHHGW